MWGQFEIGQVVTVQFGHPAQLATYRKSQRCVINGIREDMAGTTYLVESIEDGIIGAARKTVSPDAQLCCTGYHTHFLDKQNEAHRSSVMRALGF